MKAIVTRQNDDGTYDEVGMNNRTVFGPYKREATIRERASKWAKRPHRIEFFAGDRVSSGQPYKVEFRK